MDLRKARQMLEVSQVALGKMIGIDGRAASGLGPGISEGAFSVFIPYKCSWPLRVGNKSLN